MADQIYVYFDINATYISILISMLQIILSNGRLNMYVYWYKCYKHMYIDI